MSLLWQFCAKSGRLYINNFNILVAAGIHRTRPPYKAPLSWGYPQSELDRTSWLAKTHQQTNEISPLRYSGKSSGNSQHSGFQHLNPARITKRLHIQLWLLHNIIKYRDILKNDQSRSFGCPSARPHCLPLFSNGSLQCRHFGAHWRRNASLHSCRPKHGMASVPVSFKPGSVGCRCQRCQQNLESNCNILQ